MERACMLGGSILWAKSNKKRKTPSFSHFSLTVESDYRVLRILHILSSHGNSWGYLLLFGYSIIDEPVPRPYRSRLLAGLVRRKK